MTAEAPPDLLLDGTRPWEGAALPLQPGQCVRGALGKRPSVVVPPAGLIVAVDRVRFENIDFVWKHTTASAAMIELRAGHGEFHGCTFQASAAASAAPAAIAWTHPAGAAAAGGASQRPVAIERLCVPWRGGGDRLPHAGAPWAWN